MKSSFVFFREIRFLQILLMGSLLTIGVVLQDFSVRIEQILLTFCLGIATQFLALRILGLQKVGYLSAIITCMGTSLLLRSNNLWVPAASCSLAIAAKFLLRIRNKHLFNPAMLSVIIGINVFPNSWISPGQWGYELAMLAWLLAFGFLVATRARTHEMSLGFLAFYGALLAIRTWYFGYEWQVWLHQFQNGALILFTFFMITDPKTSPDHLIARLLHTLLVALVAFVWQFYFFWNSNLIYALLLASFVVPIWDRLFIAKKFEWT
ncbi:MAG: RnfABCDGE type electron transport complex subunit D [Spirochaetota bacterium]